LCDYQEVNLNMIPDYSDPASFIDPCTSEEIALDWA